MNGCKTDLSLYPLVFSTEDFKKQFPYYRKVLAPFKQFSLDIIYIAFGYSFSDDFSEKILDKIENTDFRQKRLLYCVDPFINEDRLSYFKSRDIVIIKMTFEDFFLSYQKWYNENHKNYLKNLQKFTNPDNSIIKIDTSSRIYLDGSLIQMKDDYRFGDKLKKIDFYFGAEPSYQVVVDDYDVIKKVELEKLLKIIECSFEEHSKTTVPKFILVNGDFGTGKTTFTLRAIKEYLKLDSSTLAFEITKSLGIKKGYLSQLIKDSSATKFIFYCDNIETDSVFKSFNELRIDLASEQYSNISIVFISSIRANILEKFKNNNKVVIKNNVEFGYRSTYDEAELTQLVENLKEVDLLEYRDLEEKKSIVYNISIRYTGDSFITLYKLIENGTHYKLLQKAYDELSPDIKNAFKITALIHRFNMKCPAGIIKHSLKNLDWNEFTERVVRGDGKRILFQENAPSVNDDPDLFFTTKHPVIAEALIKTILKNSEKNALYKNIFSSLTFSNYNATFVVDLIKNLRNNDSDITSGQIDNYYELAKKEFDSSTHFVLSYITNIEKKTSNIKVLKDCIKDIEVLEASFEKRYRNHRLIHRKGSLNFKIAKILYNEKSPKDEVEEYLQVAEDWFDIKKHLDPSSLYSYIDYFNLLLWKLKNLILDDDERIELLLTINELFDEAYRILYTDTDIINDLFEEFSSYTINSKGDIDYLEFLLEKYQDVETRPMACILLYYYYSSQNEIDWKKCEDLVEEMKNYTDQKEVVYFLFKYYGRNLHLTHNRLKFFELIRYNEFLKEKSTLRFFYFSSICEFYDYRWKDGKDYLYELKAVKQFNLNPDFFLYWKDQDGYEQIFEGEIVMENKIKKVKIVNPFFKQFVLVSGNYSKFKEFQNVNVKLRFMFEGIQAEIVT